MMSKKKFFVFAGMTAMLFAGNSYGQELLKNNNWKKIKRNTPVNWNIAGWDRGKSRSETFQNKKVVVISSNARSGQAYITQQTKVQLPAGKNIVLSGYYRTENIVFNTKGKLFAEVKYNYGSNDKKFPRAYQLILLKPSEKWQKFETNKPLNVPIKDFYAFFMLYRASGKIYFSNLSLKVQANDSKIDSREKYVWREAESISKHAFLSKWGKKNKDYYSGKGGIYLLNDPFRWDFRVKEETNQVTLTPKRRNYFVWLRIYGFLDKTAVSVTFNKRKIYSFKTQANEQTNAKGKYAGPGEYYWQKAGSFRTAGGNASLNIKPQGRMLLDAIIVTTDPKYAPTQYEVKKLPKNNFITDTQTPYAIRAKFKVYGISDKVTTPLVFRSQGKNIKIPNNQKPAIFHVSIPANIKVKNISNHWAGKNWNNPTRWGKKFLTWKKTGTKTVDGVKHNKYEVYLYYLSLDYFIFVQADETDFQAGQKLSCNYYLEYKGKKQLEETVPLRTVALKPTKAFKTIMIGPAGGNGRSFYQEFPDMAKDMVFSGLNIINAWHLYPKRDGSRWKKMRDQCTQGKITILGEYSPFFGTFGIKEKKFQAVSLSGKSVSYRPMFCINEKSASFCNTLKYLTDQGKKGITGILFDDENFIRTEDEFDYNPLTKEQFKKYVKKHKINYIDPELVVKDKKKYEKQYKAWVNFKCDCIVEIYRKYRKAYLKGFAEAPSSTTFGKKLLIAQIQWDTTPEVSKRKSYWNYKKMATICDYISPMIYMFGGIKYSAQVGDIIEMYNKYIGKKAISPTLLCEHFGGGDIDMTQKKMFKYQILECLMQQAKMVLFWKGPSVYNPVNLQHISEAVRWAAPYEDIILNGKEYKNAFSTQRWARIKGLKLNRRILLYVTNYRNFITQKAQIKLKGKIKSVLEIGTGKQLPITNNSFSVGFKSDRGKLFLITQ